MTDEIEDAMRRVESAIGELLELRMDLVMLKYYNSIPKVKIYD